RYRQVVDREIALVEIARRAAHAFAFRGAQAGVAGQHAEIAAAAERLALAGHHQHAYGAVGAHLCRSGAHLVTHGRGHRLARLGAVELERGDVPVADELDVLVRHAASLAKVHTSFGSRRLAALECGSLLPLWGGRGAVVRSTISPRTPPTPKRWQATALQSAS